jgi:lipid A 3-O-deacylase
VANKDPVEAARRLRLYQTRIDFGSKVLFEPELALGLQLNDRVSVEASWVHLSNGRILGKSKKNQGMDDAGVRLAWKF